VIMREIGGGKLVIIIDQAHLLSKRAFDSPRDRMERTPPNVTFILCTTEIDGVPESARSLFRQLEIGPAPTIYVGWIALFRRHSQGWPLARARRQSRRWAEASRETPGFTPWRRSV
jgi:hypothetical protein